ncbi:Trp biosynthesis-associated membrane protein [Halorientalis pallida]|uniref:Tryptophan-associated transmembrane protein (Trp_oprn_chp) n=1 Tax=Halorientalis pallida TaxID=2479928 RepID=A0A498KX74_9EURY|nr:Trp biosynthesis-associated membrane protein [Halorientalis pallida]RXK50220.1 hypothetical protein EAF64_06565 [Halorientalis pallida]
MNPDVSLPGWALLAGVGAVVAAVGSLLPWATVRFDATLAELATVPETQTVSGLDGDGTITLVLAAVTLAVLAAAVVGSRPGPKTAALTALTGTLVTVVAIVDYREFRATQSRIQQRVAETGEVGSDAVTVELEPGLAVLGLGGLLLLSAGAYALLSYWRDGSGSASAVGG